MALSYFSEDVGANQELWVTDGTVLGTHVLAGFGFQSVFNLTTIGSRVFFEENDNTHGYELWTSDGTATGTMMVQDIWPGPGDSSPQDLTNVSGTLFFAANDSTGDQLWKSDGTAAGTVKVSTIDPDDLTNVNGTLYFSANDGVHGDELWKSDGTAAGTVMVADINPGALGSDLEFLTNINGTLYFGANDGTHGEELWKSDGTAAGTVMVKDIYTGAGNSAFPQDLTNVNGALYFVAADGSDGFQLWKSDGTAAGTVKVSTIDPDQDLTNVNGTIYFSYNDGVHGDELWKSDGTAAGTVMVKDIDPGLSSSSPSSLVDSDGTLYFSATDGVHGDELWKSDGTAAGTVMVKDIIGGPGSSSPFDLTAVNGGVEFYAFDGTSTGLFFSDGTGAGTVELSGNVETSTTPAATAFPNGDFNGDSYSDILWQNANGQAGVWEVNGTNLVAGGSANVGPDPGPSWTEIGTGDFNGDGHSDILWQNTNGQAAIWEMNGTNQLAGGSTGVGPNPGPTWQVIGTGDFNGDGDSDILWQNTDGQAAIWEMNGTNQLGGGSTTVGPNPGTDWKVVGSGDFNGDGHSDILWQNANGQAAIWEMNGTSLIPGGSTTVGPNPGPDWKVVGSGDFSGDGDSDILWQNANGQVGIWEMNGTNMIDAAVVGLDPGPSWKVVGTGDYNGDGHSDILLQSTSGQAAIWEMNGTNVIDAALVGANPGSSWKAVS
jgi:ELWxxDGT repeat protein